MTTTSDVDFGAAPKASPTKRLKAARKTASPAKSGQSQIENRPFLIVASELRFRRIEARQRSLLKASAAGLSSWG